MTESVIELGQDGGHESEKGVGSKELASNV
jgi:hypothetical protein